MRVRDGATAGLAKYRENGENELFSGYRLTRLGAQDPNFILTRVHLLHRDLLRIDLGRRFGIRHRRSILQLDGEVVLDVRRLDGFAGIVTVNVRPAGSISISVYSVTPNDRYRNKIRRAVDDGRSSMPTDAAVPCVADGASMRLTCVDT